MSDPVPQPILEQLLSKLLGEKSFGVPATPPAPPAPPPGSTLAPVTSPLQPDRGIIGNTQTSLRDIIKAIMGTPKDSPINPATGQPYAPRSIMDDQINKAGG